MHEFIMDRKEQKQLKAELIFAKRLGLTEDDTLDGVVSRCEKENQRRKGMLQNGEIIYGPEHFSLPAYVRYEQTRFRLDYSYQRISEEEKQAFYEANRDLFTRYHGDSFTYEEVSVIIRKRIREMEYDKEIQNILCQLN